MDVRRLWIVVLLLVAWSTTRGVAQSVEGPLPAPFWIWSPEHTQHRVPQESCYFRKEVFLPAIETARFDVAADDAFELFINGKLAGSGAAWEELTVLDVSAYLKQGKNTVAFKVTNLNGSTAGLAARLAVETAQGEPRYYVTNPTWRSSVNVLPFWNRPRYRDSRWQAAQNFGAYGDAEPWRTEEMVAKQPVQTSETLVLEGNVGRKPAAAPSFVETPGNSSLLPSAAGPALNRAMVDKGNLQTESLSNGDGDGQVGLSTESEGLVVAGKDGPINLPQFDAVPGFRVEHVVGGEDTGSLIALAFNEFGHLLAGREAGPLLLIHDTNDNGVPDTVRVACDKVSNCQGIVSVSGRVFVVGDGPQGLALYRLDDTNHDGTFETVAALVRFAGKAGEHGPHGVTLGPDGLLYLVVGNHAELKTPVAATSPYRHPYEGDLLQPRYEDPRGHAAGIKAPGGTILRCRQDGTQLETYAGGLRNAYDLTFDRSGGLFTHDSDNETDEGTPWQRSTRFLHVPAGAEFGWRSGWAKWPDYWIDVVPAVASTGRGSPTGLVMYDHTAYPEEYQGAIFSCDWAVGQINVLRVAPHGAGFAADFEPFLRGKPLNVTDIAVGPDGGLYFCTGGRGTAGHVFRVLWEKAEKSYAAPRDVADAVRQPQFRSAWGRQLVSALRHRLGTRWDQQIDALVNDASVPGHERVRALEIMHLVGPPPTDQQLDRLTHEPDALVRARAAYFLGMIGNELATARLQELLADDDAAVRRVAAEALASKTRAVPWDQVAPLLRSDDRWESWAARRLLEWNDATEWLDRGLEEQHVGAFLHASCAYLVAHPDPAGAQRILARIAELASGFVSDADFIHMLRVMELALHRASLTPADVRAATSWLAAEFPAGNPWITRELATLLVYLQAHQVNERMLDYVQSDAPREDRIHVATRLRFLESHWTSQQKIELIAFLEEARGWDGGRNLAGYLDNVQADFVKRLEAVVRGLLLSRGEQMPRAALAVLFALPPQVDDATVDALADLYSRLPPKPDEAVLKLRVGIIAVLGSRASPAALAYLRAIYDTDPERRQPVAMALAQQPDGRNWDYLVRSIPLLDGEPAREVIQKLNSVPYAPESPEHIRQLILAGLRLDEPGARDALKLLSHWTQRPPNGEDEDVPQALAQWQDWFHGQFPDQPQAQPPVESAQGTWTLEDLVTFLESSQAQSGSAERGAQVFVEAKCADCHRFQDQGKAVGPDLTTIVYRFQRREILESIIHPSQVISDQYASHTVVLNTGETLSGLLMPGGNGKVLVVQADGQTVQVNELDIEELAPSALSSMPEGLLDGLTLPQIADLFAWLASAEPPEMADRRTTPRR